MNGSLNFLENNKDKIIELQSLLTSIPAIAPEGGGDGELEKCQALEKWLRENGITDLQRFDSPDSRVACGFRPNLVATIAGEDSALGEKGSSDAAVRSNEVLPRIWVCAHMDVVPPGDLSLWKTNPWQVSRDEKDGSNGDKIYGRGVEDNQQGLCSAVFAALYFVKNGIKPKHTIKLLFVADEENGSTHGMLYLVKNHLELIRRGDIVLIPDGGDSRGETIEIAEKNLLWLKVHVSGKQTHGSRPDNGSNACLAACALSLTLHELENVFNARDNLFEPNHSTFQPTKREANVGSINIIPGEDTFYMDCRILPCYPLNKVIAKIKEIVFEIERSYDVKVDVSYPQKSESPATSENAPVVLALKSALRKVHGIEAKCIGIGGGTVGAELRREGIDAVVWSTLDDQAHQPNEYCKITNLIKDAQTLVEMFGTE